MANAGTKKAAINRKYAQGFGGKNDAPKKEPEEKLDIFFVNTTKQEKIDQLNAVADAKHIPVLFMRVTDLGEPSLSVKELTGSFKDNKNERGCTR